MTFDAIVGNPPYQIADGGNNASAMPVYQRFVELATTIEPHYASMIMRVRIIASQALIFRAVFVTFCGIKTMMALAR